MRSHKCPPNLPPQNWLLKVKVLLTFINYIPPEIFLKKLNLLLESVVLATCAIRNGNFILDQNPTNTVKRQTKQTKMNEKLRNDNFNKYCFPNKHNKNESSKDQCA